MAIDILQLAEKMKRAGVPADYGPDLSRLMVRVWKELAKGEPINAAHQGELVAELGIPGDAADEFLQRMAERDDTGNIIGIMGLSQNKKWAHHFYVDGQELRTWCAWDTLFLAQVLHKQVRVESVSPISKAQIDVTIGPEKVESYSPSSSALSIVTIDPDLQDKRALEELWSGL